MRKEVGYIGEKAAREIQVPFQVPVIGIKIHVNPAGLADGEVRATLVQMAQARTLQNQIIGFY